MEALSKKTVAWTVQNGLCCSCGICKSVCPAGCIDYTRRDGLFLPQIDASRCLDCGLCGKVCPGREMLFEEKKTERESVLGNIQFACNAWSRDPVKRHFSASGGVVSTIVDTLLRAGLYDTAFCVSSYRYEDQLKTESVTVKDVPDDWGTCSFPKSRYLPVSHEKAVAYIRANPQKRVILIGSPCALQGLRKVFLAFSMNEDRYLLLGLFCDKVFNYNVNDYFQRDFAGNKKIAAFHFKNKDSGGWPGNMKLLFADGSSAFLDKAERMKVKEYFMPERCLYCVDKLNASADISMGDNYTGQNESPLGSNTVLVRTHKGEMAWQAVSSMLEYEEVTPNLVDKAQDLPGRLINLQYAAIKQRQIQKETGEQPCLNGGVKAADVPGNAQRAYKIAMEKLRSGACYREDPEKLARQFRLEEKRRDPRNPAVLGRRLYYGIKRRLQG